MDKVKATEYKYYLDKLNQMRDEEDLKDQVPLFESRIERAYVLDDEFQWKLINDQLDEIVAQIKVF